MSFKIKGTMCEDSTSFEFLNFDPQAYLPYSLFSFSYNVVLCFPFFCNFNVLNYHYWIHNHALILPNINCKNIIRWIITKRSNVSGKSSITIKVFI